MYVITQFVFAALATVGFAIFFNVPKRLLTTAGITGGIGWVIYIWILKMSESAAFAGFVSGAFISLCGEMLARKIKQPAIVFVIPGILPLVPGTSLYYTVLYLIQKNYALSVTKGTLAVSISASIALGVLVVTSSIRTINIIIQERYEKKMAMESAKKSFNLVNHKLRTKSKFMNDIDNNKPNLNERADALKEDADIIKEDMKTLTEDINNLKKDLNNDREFNENVKNDDEDENNKID